eukprot:CAMPEP_0172028836 /NCGR_PEP_ID=MMETSP1041-20130122/17795_1 /TAXON_ID=464988 /ORGANISM="Hemiselmis andersenii, Strain CCMP439" /LENGTH=111 /DNA_ID=CAMNT_0012684929 /DNA_START=136 /DNA_END=471 /DNA_ORIENTATION=+
MAASANKPAPTADWSLTAGSSTWNKLFDRYYRKKELYAMEWGDDIDLSKMLVSGSRFAGPIAMIRDDRKGVPNRRKRHPPTDPHHPFVLWAAPRLYPLEGPPAGRDGVDGL